MPISRVFGQMLAANLTRDSNLAFSTDLLYIDVLGNRVGIKTTNPSDTFEVVGNVVVGNVVIGNVGTVSATGNVTGGNIDTGGLITATGNITGGNLITGGLITATGNVTGGNLVTLGNLISGNLLTTGVVSASGNVTGGNIDTVGLISATGNVTSGNIDTSGLITATGNIVSSSGFVAGNIFISSSGNIDLGNNYINNLLDPVQNQDAATKIYVDNNIGNIGSAGNLTFSNTTISTSLANGNITLSATGTETVIISGSIGFVVPVGNSLQRPLSPAVGTLRFNSFTKNLEVWDGTEWDLGSTSVITNQTIVPDGSTNTYTLDEASTAEGILVSINGIAQTPQIDYTVTSGDQLTFTTTPLTTDIVQVRFISTTSTVSAITNNYGNSLIQITETPEIQFVIENNIVASIDASTIFNISNSHSLQLPVYDTANASALSNVSVGQVIYVSDGANGQPCLAAYSNGAWKRIDLSGNISAI